MLHKSHTNSLINMINYMSNYTEASKFRGFITVSSYYGATFGQMLPEGLSYMAVHVEGDNSEVCSDYETEEEAQIKQGLTFLVCILGSDNGSYMKRFIDKEAFEAWFLATEIYQVESDPGVLFYNS